jgi:glycosyltransferase involved in cell wall biosynthesis
VAGILFIVAEDRAFVRRHSPLLRAAREIEMEPIVAAPPGAGRAAIQGSGARFLPLASDPAGRSPRALARAVQELKGLIRAHKPAIVQVQGIGPVLAGSLAARLAGQERLVCAFNGLGFLAARADAFGDGARLAARLFRSAILDRPGTRLVFDNPDDAALVSQGNGGAAVSVIPGTGVDPLIHSPEPMPWSPPLKLAFASPLLWVNGPDTAVDAVTRARAAGAEVTLSLIGAALPPGRSAVPAAKLQAWSRQPGVGWFAPPADPAQLWRQHHALVLPSRGGDGLPALMTEAASSARPVLTSDVGGCGSFIRDGIDGRVTPVNDVRALAAAMVELARSPGLVERMGRAGRERVLGGYTERDVIDGHKQLWRAMLSGGPAS